ncbi:hypothetical protein D3C73_1336650 [compost metagenome]
MLHIVGLVAIRVLQANVDDMRPFFHLGACNFGSLFVFSFGDHALEFPRAQHVRPFSNQIRSAIRFNVHGIDP